MLPTIEQIRTGFPSAGEHVERILSGQSFQIQRIISNGDPSGADFWYDQPNPEWVLLICGEAQLEFDPGGLLQMHAGEYLQIPAGCRHRVSKVSQDAIWLAVHYHE